MPFKDKAKKKEWNKEWLKTEQGKISHKKSMKKYYEKNREDILKYNKGWREKNKERLSEYTKKRYEKNKEYWKNYHEKNREEKLIKMKEYRKGKRKKFNEYSRIWAKTENGKATNQRRHVARQAREKNIINTLTAQEWLDILEKHNYRCAYCDVEFNCELLPEKDHIIPISKVGHNTKENVVPACRS